MAHIEVSCHMSHGYRKMGVEGALFILCFGIQNTQNLCSIVVVFVHFKDLVKQAGRLITLSVVELKNNARIMRKIIVQLFHLFHQHFKSGQNHEKVLYCIPRRDHIVVLNVEVRGFPINSLLLFREPQLRIRSLH